MSRLSLRVIFGLILTICLLPTGVARGEPVVPAFSPDDFVQGAPIDNPYFPLVPGTLFRTGGEVTDDEGETLFERLEDLVTSETLQIAGVRVRVVRAKTFQDDVLVEDTRDYYAQDKAGNVWYLGEDTKEFEYDDEGNVIGTDTAGSWRAGVNDAQPGFIMPANPPVGFEYYQEFAVADEAVDFAEIISLNDVITTPLGTFSNVRKILEQNPNEPGVLEHKLYAPGIGLVQIEEDLQPNGEPRSTLFLENVTTGGAAAIPLPPAAWTGLATMGMVLAGRGLRVWRRKMK